MAHDVTQSDIDRVKSVLYDLYPEINSSHLLHDEIESAAMAGLAEASRKFDPAKSSWYGYSLRIALYRVWDTLRIECQRPCGITGGTRNKSVGIAILRHPDPMDSENVEIIFNQQPETMIEHSHSPDDGGDERLLHFELCVDKLLSTLDFRPAMTRHVWRHFFDGYRPADIAEILNMSKSYVSMALRMQASMVMDALVDTHYSLYPYPE